MNFIGSVSEALSKRAITVSARFVECRAGRQGLRLSALDLQDSGPSAMYPPTGQGWL